jgi:hypothetical protein
VVKNGLKTKEENRVKKKMKRGKRAVTPSRERRRIRIRGPAEADYLLELAHFSTLTPLDLVVTAVADQIKEDGEFDTKLWTLIDSTSKIVSQAQSNTELQAFAQKSELKDYLILPPILASSSESQTPNSTASQ